MKYALNLDWDAVFPLLLAVMEEDLKLCFEEATDLSMHPDDRALAVETAGHIQWLLDHYYTKE